MPKIAQRAHSHGLRVSGHVPAGMIARQFVLDGADEIQHMNFIFLDFMPSVKDTNTRSRFTEVAAHAAELHHYPTTKSGLQTLTSELQWR